MNDEGIYKRVKSIQFGIFSPAQIKEIGVAKIVTPELYDKEGYPVDGGLMDVRLGVIDPGLTCKTDGQRLKDSLGHFGYIELARPIVHISFVTIVLNLLRSTCRDCGRVLIPEEKISYYGKQLYDAEADPIEGHVWAQVIEVIKKLKTITKCPHCEAKQLKVTLEKPTTFLEDDNRVSPIEIRTRLERIPDKDLKLFGLDPASVRPEWMVLTILPIPPVTMRPSITLETGERSEDDLTHKLGDIVRINQRLFENINAGAPEIIIEDLWDLLQYHITTFFNNEVAQLPPARHRSGQPLKTITARIKSKEGRIRDNLVGKRVNFSARTVISPDPRLNINEVGVPKVIAMKLTVPETINEWNQEYMLEFIKRGPDQYPGANYIVRPDGKRKRITDETKEQLLEELQPGFIVERHLMDGDISLFNRQPSLHRMSMMCHRVKVLPGLTLRLNPAVCAPYNADFDGDEMNLHIPQTEEARAEAETLMEVQTQIISPRYGLSIIGANQDAIAGNYLLTQDKMVFTRNEAIDVLARVGVKDFSKLPKKDTLTGKEVFSMIIPEDFGFIGSIKSDREQVIIEKGKLIQGVLDGTNLGAGQGLLLRNLHKKYGAQDMVEILGRIYKMGLQTVTNRGFSISLRDTDLTNTAKDDIAKSLSKAEEVVDSLIAQYQEGTLELMPGRDAAETLELRILVLLNQLRNETGRIVAENAPQDSETMVMVRSGARGNLINLAQMAGIVGQQSLHGGRISKGFTNRTLSCFAPSDMRATPRGFIQHGFKKGLRPHELFFMAMTGRDSLMDTALRTPKSGYLYRRLANALQDLKVEYDYTVRDASKKIIQFQYGEDGIDVARSENGIINVDNIINRVEAKK